MPVVDKPKEETIHPTKRMKKKKKKCETVVNNDPESPKVNLLNVSTENKVSETKVVMKRNDTLSILMRTFVAGNVYQYLKSKFSDLKVKPSGKINRLWSCLHSEMRRIFDKNYKFSDPYVFRNHIQKLGTGARNDDLSLTVLADTFQISIQIMSLIQGFKKIIYGETFSMKIELVHVGYDNFIAIVANDKEICDELSQEDIQILAKINTKRESVITGDVKADKQLIERLRLLLQGTERAQDSPEILDTNSKKKAFYDIYPLKDVELRSNLETCTLHIKNAHLAYATIMRRDCGKANIISIMGRKNCGYNTFEGDVVYVEINDLENLTGKVLGVKQSYHKPINTIYICKICRDQGNLMMPLDGSIPKIHVDNQPGRRKYESERKERRNNSYVFREEQKSYDLRKRESSKFADNLYVSIYTLRHDKKTKKNTFSDFRVEEIDPEICDKLFLVYYEYWDVSFMYPFGKVVGMISTYDSFKDTLHLILPLCKVEPLVINGRYKNEIESIRKRVKEVKKLPHDIVPQGAMVFTIDNEETMDMDDALSYHIENGKTVIGVHISDITKYISPQHEIYKQAKSRFATAYTPSHLGEAPVYLIEKELTTDCFSLVRNEPRAVLSVMFHFTKEGGHNPVNVTFGETFIRSKYKLSYKVVEGWIKETSCPRGMEENLFIAIKGCYDKAMSIRRGRLPSSYFVRQANYNRPDFQFDENFNAHLLIEEFMIMANEQVAKKIYEVYPNMSLIRVQDAVTDYEEWENRLFDLSNMDFQSSLRQCCDLLHITRDSENHKDLVISRQFYENFRRYLKEDLNKARNMMQYDAYINDFYLHLSYWHKISGPARYECSLEGCVDNRHFSLDKDLYTHFTSPIRRFSDVIVHMLLKSALHHDPNAYGLDQDTVTEVCTIANERTKNIKLFEKYCVPFAIFEVTPSVYSFVLDCVCCDITNEELHFVHRSLQKSKKSIKFAHLSLNMSPVQLKFNESSSSCMLLWKKKLFSESLPLDKKPRNHFTIDNHLYDVTLPHYAHGLFGKIRHSDLPAEDLKRELTNLAETFRGNVKEYETVSSNVSANPIIEISLKLYVRNNVRIQFCSYKFNGMKRLNPELLIVHPSFQVCLIHPEDPVMCFVPGGKLQLEHNDIKWRFSDLREYTNYFKPLLHLESLEQIMKEKSEFTLQDVAIRWIHAKSPLTNAEEIYGIMELSLTACERAFIEFSDESEKVVSDYSEIIDESLWVPNGDLICIRGKRKEGDNYWVGHGIIVNVRKYVVDKSHDGKKVVVFMLTQSDFDISSDDCTSTFAVEVYFRLISSKRQITAVSSIRRSRFLKEIIFGKDIDENTNDQSTVDRIVQEYHSRSDIALNVRQMEGLKNALTLKFSLIWGPPGTGKTTIGCVLAFCFCIKNLKNGVVLYCGPSNECVNLVIHSMEQKFDKRCPKMLRIFSKQQELADFPLPGHFTKAIPLKESLKKICLHHLIRDLTTEAGAELRKYDLIFQKIIKSPDTFCQKDHDGQTVFQLIKEYKNVVQKAKKMYIATSNSEMVICTTSVAGSYIIEEFVVKQVIVDEAGMCTEPETLVPINKSCRTIESVVLIGDHKQLRPIINNDLASRRGLQISLFERYQSMKREYVTMLNQQYRMHPSICEFPSKSFYTDKLRTEPSKKWSGLQDSDFEFPECYSNWNGTDYSFAKPNYQECLIKSGYSAIPDELWPGKRTTPYTCFKYPSEWYPERLVFIHTVGDEIVQSVSTSAGGENSRANKQEVDVVGYIYDRLISRWPCPADAVDHVAVLTQYRLQESLLQIRCKQKLSLRKITTDPIVKTVIKSQGSEYDYVIFSTVRSLRNEKDIMKNPTPGWENKYLGFITDQNQVNVALTRAQKGFIIIGNKNLLSANSMWNRLLLDLDRRGCVINDCDAFI